MSNTWITPAPGLTWGQYPEHRTSRIHGEIERRLLRAGRRITGLANSRLHHVLSRHDTQRTNAVMARMATLADWSMDELDAEVQRLRRLMAVSGLRHDTVTGALAVVGACCERTIGFRPFHTQVAAANALLGGHLAEMATGEGKTLACALAASVAAMAGIPVHVLTANDYLVVRDQAELAPLYHAIGLTSAFIAPGQSPDDRYRAYRADITYATARELVFDYLRDRVSLQRENPDISWQVNGFSPGNNPTELMLRGLCMAIVDEADSIFLDDATTPFILSTQDNSSNGSSIDTALITACFKLASGLWINRDFSLSPDYNTVTLTSAGEQRIASLRLKHGIELKVATREVNQLVQQALKARHLLKAGEHYVLRNDAVELIDNTTGRIATGRVLAAGLQQMVELKEGVAFSGKTRTVARISFQQFFARYIRLSGISGSLREAAGELATVYGLQIRTIALRRPSRRYIAPPQVFTSREAKLLAICAQVRQARAVKRPVLIGLVTVEQTRDLSQALTRVGIAHQVLDAANDKDEARVVARAGQPGTVTVATNMAGRGTDIRISEHAGRVGGLLLIACQLNRERRMDRQLFGRTARQGQPGEARQLLSLDQVIGERLASKLQTRETTRNAGIPGLSLGRGNTAPLNRPTTFVLMQIARLRQRFAEIRHRRVRLQLLEANESRERSYSLSSIHE